ncbi:hypothetical protein Tco_0954261 [Tanacetum coccineum]|uniref:Retrovirus-related Pol polyprotein from transposon TNT 1-94-like beta-barrel domain-containing protein n=1 Tax=Tanacetum coccineum TaxID=301880 RepID=A0ABQ5E284_9ASTR
MDLQDQRVIDIGCSRHMTGNMSYLTDYEEIDRGYVTFGDNPKGGKSQEKVHSLMALEVQKQVIMQIWKFSRDDEDDDIPKKGIACIEGSKLDKANAGRASTIQVTRSLDFSGLPNGKRASDTNGFQDKRMKGGIIEEEVYVCQPPGFEDPDFPDRVQKLKSIVGLLLHLELAYTDSDYLRASLDMKSTTGGCQFLGCRLISWQCKKQTVVANSITEAEYVAASRKAKKSVKLMMEKLFRMELELMLFWSTVKAKTINGEVQLHALVDGKKIIITESTVRRDLQL